ncbi:MAG TPA: hypothetical protein DIC57_04425 [Sphaerochaeta sp.]|nr:hypothetical protein [Sphaerochaeta sp.]
MDSRESATAILTGWYTGDGMGSQTDGMQSSEVEALCPDGIEEIYTLEESRPLCGMSSEVSDLLTLLALSIVTNKDTDVHHVKASYRKYIQEGDGPGEHIRRILQVETSKADHSLALIRCPIHGILKATQSQRKWLDFLKAETQITSSSDLCLQTVLLLSSGFGLLMEEEYDDPLLFVSALAGLAKRNRLDERIVAALHTALNQNPLAVYDTKQSSFVLTTLLVVMHSLIAFDSYEDGMKALVMRGGNARTVCALYGGFAAALYGMESIPERWTAEVFPSPALEAMIKKQTLFKRETIRMEKLAVSLTAGLLVVA